MDKLIIALIILVILLYFFHINKFDIYFDNFANINSKKNDTDNYQVDPSEDDYNKVGYHNLFDWNKSKAIPISKEANQIAYDINSDEATGLAYNSRYPWIAPTLNPDEIPNSQMNVMN